MTALRKACLGPNFAVGGNYGTMVPLEQIHDESDFVVAVTHLMGRNRSQCGWVLATA